MKVGDNEIGLLLNVRARINIAQLTPSKTVEDINGLFTEGTEEERVEHVYRVARILNHEYEVDKRKKQGKPIDLTKDTYSIIDKDDFMTMNTKDFMAFIDEVFDVLYDRRTVIAEPKKTGSQAPKSK